MTMRVGQNRRRAAPLDGGLDTVLGEGAFVIQHPLGGRKRVAIVRNQASFVDDRVVHYLSDTQAGSSGSPVFNADGRLIALHHAGGRPQVVTGKDPVLKNEGIRIPRVAAGLAAVDDSQMDLVAIPTP
jgi:Trypsin-like peptidase domain